MMNRRYSDVDTPLFDVETVFRLPDYISFDDLRVFVASRIPTENEVRKLFGLSIRE